jgi:hypothetical protein
MPTYRVYAKATTYFYLDVKAESETEALEIGERADGGDFIEDMSPENCSWDIVLAEIIEAK